MLLLAKRGAYFCEKTPFQKTPFSDPNSRHYSIAGELRFFDRTFPIVANREIRSFRSQVLFFFSTFDRISNIFICRMCFPILIAVLFASKSLKKLMSSTPSIGTQAVSIAHGIAKDKPRSIVHPFAENRDQDRGAPAY